MSVAVTCVCVQHFCDVLLQGYCELVHQSNISGRIPDILLLHQTELIMSVYACVVMSHFNEF